MTYSTEHITKVESWTALGYDQDDLALDTDVTACMTDGETGVSCDEYKEGTTNCKVEIDIGVPPSAITSLRVRFFLTEMHNVGNNALLPYIDANSVSTVNEVVKAYDTSGVWVEHVCSAEFIAQLADIGGKCYVRLGSPDTAKSKLGEVEIDVEWQTYPLSGVTKDKNGTILGSCQVALFRVISEGPPKAYKFVESKTSDAVTGAYSFDVPEGIKYMVSAIKPDGTTVMDVTPSDLEGEVP